MRSYGSAHSDLDGAAQGGNLRSVLASQRGTVTMVSPRWWAMQSGGPIGAIMRV